MKRLEEKQEKQLEQEQDKMSKINLKRKNWLRKRLEQKILGILGKYIQDLLLQNQINIFMVN